MAIEEAQIGVVAAQMMEELAREYGQQEAAIETVALVVFVRGENDRIHWKFTPGTPNHAGAGLLDVVVGHLRSGVTRD